MMTGPPTAPSTATPLRRLARTCLSTLPVGLWRRLAPKDLITLNYHVVSEEDLPQRLLYAYKTPAQFERDVEYVRGAAIGYQEASEARRGEARLPEGRFLITFDDGYSQCFDVARPILARSGVPGLFFINTAFLDDQRPFVEVTAATCLRATAGLDPGRASEVLACFRAHRDCFSTDPESNTALSRGRLGGIRLQLPPGGAHLELALWVLGVEEDDEAALAMVMERAGIQARNSNSGRVFMTSEQVRQMAAEGFAFGSHGITHMAMQRLPLDEMERRVVESCALVHDLTGQDRVPFAFPYSGNGIARSHLAGIRSRQPFVDLFFDTEGFRRDAPFVVQRIAADLPPAPGDETSNVPALLRRAWSRRSAWYRDHAHAGAGARADGNSGP
jgi:peptidoglycan/xylan/chitin deacetylase (PgdA/CDA1 family)